MELFTRLSFAALVFTFSARAFLAEPLQSTTSPSRQFLIFGTDAQLRGAVSDAAEEVKANLLSILHQPDNWKTPIVIQLQFPQANLPEIPKSALYFSQTGSGLKLQLDLVIGAGVHAPQLQRDLLRAILLERIYRAQPNLAPGTVYVNPPDWLLEGVLTAAPGYKRAELADVAGSLPESKMISLGEFLTQRPDRLDAPARLLYRTYAFALVQLLLDGAGGSEQLSRYIDNLSSSSSDPIADLKSHFSALASSDLEKDWQSNLAKLGASRRFELLTFRESEERLAQTLRLKLPKRTSRLEDFVEAKPSLTEKALLNRLSQELMLLGATANPMLRPIVSEYQQIAQLVAAGKRKGIAERLARVKATRTRLVARMGDIDDYLNWFEATQSKTNSGVFNDYFRTAAERDAPEPRRRDALSVYLDALEQQTHN